MKKKEGNDSQFNGRKASVLLYAQNPSLGVRATTHRRNAGVSSDHIAGRRPRDPDRVPETDREPARSMKIAVGGIHNGTASQHRRMINV